MSGSSNAHLTVKKLLDAPVRDAEASFIPKDFCLTDLTTYNKTEQSTQSRITDRNRGASTPTMLRSSQDDYNRDGGKELGSQEICSNPAYD